MEPNDEGFFKVTWRANQEMGKIKPDALFPINDNALHLEQMLAFKHGYKSPEEVGIVRIQ